MPKSKMPPISISFSRQQHQQQGMMTMSSANQNFKKMSAFGDEEGSSRMTESTYMTRNSFFTNLLLSRQEQPPPAAPLAVAPSSSSSSSFLFVSTVILASVIMGLLIWRLSAVKNKNKKTKRRTPHPPPAVLTSVQQAEYESLIGALQEELQAKSVHETEQAIRHRKEKKLLQARIQQLQQSPRQTVKVEEEKKAEHHSDYNNHNSTSVSLEQLQDQVSALTQLTQQQAQQLQSKQQQVEQLHNVMGELQQALELKEQQNRSRSSTHSSNHSTVSIDTQSTSRNSSHRSSSCRRNSMDETSHDQIVRRLLTTIARQSPDVQEQVERQLVQRRLSQHESNSTPPTTITQPSMEEQNDSDSDALSVASSCTSSSVDTTPHASTILPNHNKVVLLCSSMPGNVQVSLHQSRLETIFRHGLSLAEPDSFEVLDGCDPDLTQLRNDLFRISGLHAVYPQVFLICGGTDIQFLGDYPTIVELHDTRQLPLSIGMI